MKKLIYILVFLFCFQFMGLLSLPPIFYGVTFLILGIMNYRKNLAFNKIYLALMISFLLNFLSSYYFRGQSLIDTFRASSEFYSLALFWLFYKWDLNLDHWEQILWWLCLVFGICFIIQYFALPNIIFGGQIRVGIEEQRIAIFGQGLGSFSVLFGLNKFFTNYKKKYIIIVFTGLFAVFGCGYRTMISALFISVLVLLYRMKINKKQLMVIAVMSSILAVFILNSDFIQYQIGNMMNRNETLASNSLEDDFRYMNIVYHYTEYFKSPIEMIFGSGMPFPFSKYGSYHDNVIIDMYHFWYSDWGLIGLSWIIGIPTVLIMIYYSLKMFFTEVPEKYLYIGIYFFNIVISSFTTHEFYIHLNFVVQAILFCVFSKIIEKNKINNSKLGKWKVFFEEKIQNYK